MAKTKKKVTKKERITDTSKIKSLYKNGATKKQIIAKGYNANTVGRVIWEYNGGVQSPRKGKPAKAKAKKKTAPAKKKAAKVVKVKSKVKAKPAQAKKTAKKPKAKKVVIAPPELQDETVAAITGVTEQANTLETAVI